MHNRKGFTLIELLVVIAIIAILAVIVVMSLNAAQIKARNSTAKSDVNQMGKAVASWRTTQNVDFALVPSDPGEAAHPFDAAHPLIVLDSTNTGVAGGWGLFTNPADPTTGYPLMINQIPAPTYVYRYSTTADGSSYCIDTNIRVSAGVNDTGFAVEQGNSKNYDGGVVTDNNSAFPTNIDGTCQ